ncbi:glycosyltransferase family 25 protein [Mesorhizobium sp. INR15]|uniref:glycosyltransferase family 25 protein n=1 Tax=Mesorhizobium sp. INR15 TaxID=2654248 RepID=UPI0018C1715E|nr:glycosyl transferase [Mesorhizobium sp. INR15]
MNCLVINLDRSVDRLAHITSEFAKIGVAFERVSAVDASHEFPLPASPHLTKSQIACSLSHRKCWQIIADGADQYGTVFEDDAVFSSDAGRFLSDYSWVPVDADIVKLETFFEKTRIGNRQIEIGNGYAVARLVGSHSGTAGYLISRSAARKLLHHTRRRISGVADHFLFDATCLTCILSRNYQLTPAICTQAQFVHLQSPLATLIQINAPHWTKGPIAKIRSEFMKAFGHCWNGTLWGTRKVGFITLGQLSPGPRNEFSACVCDAARPLLAGGATQGRTAPHSPQLPG